MFQPNSTITMEEDINVDETTLNHVKKFTYLGSITASDGHIGAELKKRMSKASMSFGRLRERHITTMCHITQCVNKSKRKNLPCDHTVYLTVRG